MHGCAKMTDHGSIEAGRWKNGTRTVLTKNFEEGQSMAVPSAFSWMGVFRPGKFNQEHEQYQNEEDHDHSDADQPYCDAVS